MLKNSVHYCLFFYGVKVVIYFFILATFQAFFMGLKNILCGNSPEVNFLFTINAAARGFRSGVSTFVSPARPVFDY
jgi:hypothetical protein